MPKHLLSHLTAAGVADASTQAIAAYGSPFTWVLSYPVGTVERAAVQAAYHEVQRLLCITGLCISLLLVIFSLCLRNPRLGDEQSLEDAEGFRVPGIGGVGLTEGSVEDGHVRKVGRGDEEGRKI